MNTSQRRLKAEAFNWLILANYKEAKLTSAFFKLLYKHALI